MQPSAPTNDSYLKYECVIVYVERLGGVHEMLGTLAPSASNASFRDAIEEAREPPQPANDSVVIGFVLAIERHWYLRGNQLVEL